MCIDRSPNIKFRIVFPRAKEILEIFDSVKIKKMSTYFFSSATFVTQISCLHSSSVLYEALIQIGHRDSQNSSSSQPQRLCSALVWLVLQEVLDPSGGYSVLGEQHVVAAR